MNYVILSSGAYSDYDPNYYVGEKEVTQAELTAKSLEIGDEMWAWFEALPEKEGKNWKGEPVMEKYDPSDLEKYISSSGPIGEDFTKKMEEWLFSEGYTKVPDGLPEVNVYYDVPRSTTH